MNQEFIYSFQMIDERKCLYTRFSVSKFKRYDGSEYHHFASSTNLTTAGIENQSLLTAQKDKQSNIMYPLRKEHTITCTVAKEVKPSLIKCPGSNVNL